MNPLLEELQQTFGRSFTLKKELRAGGMARVFVARDESLGRDIVIKVLPPELTYAFSVARFEREIKLAARLQEPHIVPVLSAGQTVGGYPYFTMPFVRGESLRERIRQGPIPLDESLSILRDVAAALAYAHRQGIVHRDIKPENILLSEGTAVVTDFGIAKAVQAARKEARPEITQPGDTVGTPMYMAPEQAASDPTTDQRADVYAWGVVAYELITGRHPFAEHLSSPQSLLAAQMSDTPRAMSNTNTRIPRGISDLVMRCLSKRAAQRPTSGAQLLTGLSNPRGSHLPHIGSPSRRGTIAIVAAAVVVVALVGGAIWRARAMPDGPPLIAVLPFETEGVGADSSFADGLRDAVTGKLARLKGLSVIDRKSVSSLAMVPGTTPQQVGRSLHANYVLTASVRWAKGADGQPQVRVSPVLIRVSDGTTSWAGEPEVVSPADPFTIQARVATRVAEALDVEMVARERNTIAMRATNDTGAFAAVVRGKRIIEENTSSSYAEYEKALREFEHAYTLDPEYADALGLAAQMLAVMSYSRGKVLLDSATILAQRALSIDPTQANAVGTLAFRGMNRPAEALATLKQAVRENPSNVELLAYEQGMLQYVGDSAGAWEAVKRVLPLAPASKSVLGTCFITALALRHYKDAADFVARERALDPTAIIPLYHAATLAEKLGDSLGIARAVRELRARGGRLGAGDGDLMRKADAALRNEFANGSLASFAPGSALDSVNFYAEKAELFAGRGNYVRARTLADSAWHLEKRMADDPSQSIYVRRGQYEVLAWLAALLGDRNVALSMLAKAGQSPTIAKYPRGVEAVQLSCTTAAVYGFLGDAESMMPFARKCFTSANGYAISYLNDPEFAWTKKDRRMQEIIDSSR
ncbi:MAG TPA: protein kinase [Gemmatimonadaceae bacterium]|jgi:serine/threonine-protein kinase|nr:protein kinase [Gemmatimonadaceae bacterium]